jgi:hypothetical protein
MISPAGRERQENGDVSVVPLYLALDHFPIYKALYVTLNFVLRNEIEYPLIERDHCFHRRFVNDIPEFIPGLRFDYLREIFLAKYFPDISWIIGWKSIVAVEDQLKGSPVFPLETSPRKSIRIAISFRDGQPARISHRRPEKVLPASRIGRQEHALVNGVWVRVRKQEHDPWLVYRGSGDQSFRGKSDASI